MEKINTGGFDTNVPQVFGQSVGNVNEVGGPQNYDFSVGDFKMGDNLFFPPAPAPAPGSPPGPSSPDDFEVIYDVASNAFYYWDPAAAVWTLIDPSTVSGGGGPTTFPFANILRYTISSPELERLEIVEPDETTEAWTAFKAPVNALDLPTWALGDINEVLPAWFQFSEVAEVGPVPGPAVAPKHILTFLQPSFVDTAGEIHIVLPALPTSDPGGNEVWLSAT